MAASAGVQEHIPFRAERNRAERLLKFHPSWTAVRILACDMAQCLLLEQASLRHRVVAMLWMLEVT